ncbi:MAG: D-alanyl-D-alanine carboxypeptidase family protein [Pseudomonadota bacterium]
MVALFVAMMCVSWTASAAQYAAMVMDARTGEVLHSRNADTRLHPASLTKMMTLYVVFDAIEKGEITLDQRVKISKKAAAEPPSKLGLRAGQRISIRHLIRAAAIKSANDAATALAEAVSGSEAAFARRMNRTAKALGMTRSTFKNAHGLTEAGHLSTARDMTIMGRHLFFDFPEYYNIFKRRTTDAGVREVANTNRRFLANYKGADGIKTGYTRAAGFNLVASAERGQERIITTVFGGRSTTSRNAKVAELMDLGFSRAPSTARIVRPQKPNIEVPSTGAGKTIRVVTAVQKSMVPALRPVAAPAEGVLVAMAETIDDAVAAAQLETPSPTVTTASILPMILPKPKPDTETEARTEAVVEPEAPVAVAMAPAPRPTVRPEDTAGEPERIVVTRLSTSGGRQWGINVGRFTTRHEAERILLKTALAELGTLDTALRKVASSAQGHDANFVGMTKESAALACRRLQARNMECSTLAPG